MLAAKKLDQYIDAPIPELPQDEAVVHRSKSRVKPRFYKFLYVSTVVCLFLSGLYFCSLAMGVATKGYEINRLKEEISALETANERLRLEIVQLSSLERVEMLACTELGMKKPEAGDYLLLPGAESLMPEREPAWAPDFELAGLEEPHREMPIFHQKMAGFLAVALGQE